MQIILDFFLSKPKKNGKGVYKESGGAFTLKKNKINHKR
jgi:hypothetical protein